MFNEKNLRRLQKPAKVSFDKFDLEAESEGNARRFFNKNELKPLLGRRIGKESRKADGYAKTAEAKATAHIVKVTAERAVQIIVKERILETR